MPLGCLGWCVSLRRRHLKVPERALSRVKAVALIFIPASKTVQQSESPTLPNRLNRVMGLGIAHWIAQEQGPIIPKQFTRPSAKKVQPWLGIRRIGEYQVGGIALNIAGIFAKVLLQCFQRRVHFSSPGVQGTHDPRINVQDSDPPIGGRLGIETTYCQGKAG